jgi:hypothetical protein
VESTFAFARTKAGKWVMDGTMKFELKRYRKNVADADLIQDVKDVAIKTGRNTVTIAEYEQFGKFNPSTIQRRFRSWFYVLNIAGLQASRSDLNIPEEDLLANIKNVWIYFGRQPKYNEIKKPISKYSARTYEKRFGSWNKALEALIAYIDIEKAEEEYGESETEASDNRVAEKKSIRMTKRELSERLRFSILLRDGFRCHACGRSPINSPGVELQVDHVIPWSQGGETIADNLITKCKECNLGKGNAFDR